MLARARLKDGEIVLSWPGHDEFTKHVPAAPAPAEPTAPIPSEPAARTPAQTPAPTTAETTGGGLA